MKSRQLTAVLVGTGCAVMLVGTAMAAKQRSADGGSVQAEEKVADVSAARSDYFEAVLREPLVERSLALDFEAGSYVGFSLMENSRVTALLDFEVDAMTGQLRPAGLSQAQNMVLGRDVNLLPLWLGTQDHAAIPTLEPLTLRSAEIPHDDVTVSLSGGSVVEVVLWHNDEVVGFFYAEQIPASDIEMQQNDAGYSNRVTGSRIDGHSRDSSTQDFNHAGWRKSGDFAQDRNLWLVDGSSSRGGLGPNREPIWPRELACARICDLCANHPVEALRALYCTICDGPRCQ
jgi:hypothetical protein